MGPTELMGKPGGPTRVCAHHPLPGEGEQQRQICIFSE